VLEHAPADQDCLSQFMTASIQACDVTCDV
jgi:hypothetical protein